MTDRQTDRYTFIDASRGWGIILVIFGHLLVAETPLYTVIYSFHMPFFFLISGMFVKPQLPFRKYVWKYTKKLLFPFIIVFIIGFIITFSIPSLRTIGLSDVLRQLIYARPIEIHVGPIWFLACLFDVTVFFYFYYRFILSKRSFFLKAFSLGFLSIFAYYLPKLENRINFRLPFKIDVAFMALVFYTLGFLLKKHILDQMPEDSALQKIVVSVFAIGALAVFPKYVLGQTFLSSGVYGNELFIYLFTALCGIYLLLVLGCVTKRISIINYIGKNSLVFFSVHSLVILLYDAVLAWLKIYKNMVTEIIGLFFVLFVMMIISRLNNRVRAHILRIGVEKNAVIEKQS